MFGLGEILLEPGPGWGTGSHETTQLCLQAIAILSPRDRPSWKALDFGAGSGMLSIAAARLGAEVDAIEIDDDGLGLDRALALAGCRRGLGIRRPRECPNQAGNHENEGQPASGWNVHKGSHAS